MGDPEKIAQPTDGVVIPDEVIIPAVELHFRFSRSSGPGGQHVNRSETRVELLFDLAGSPSLSDGQKARLMNRLPGYVDSEGILRVVSSATRSQAENRARAITRFQALVAAALRRRKRRLPTAPSATSRERRLTQKRARSRVKQTRQKVGRDNFE